jgi:hypothetical protein
MSTATWRLRPLTRSPALETADRVHDVAARIDYRALPSPATKLSGSGSRHPKPPSTTAAYFFRSR